MSRRRATKEDVLEFEGHIDATFFAWPLPPGTPAQQCALVLAVTEDVSRLRILHATSAAERAGIDAHLNRQKYAIKHALSRIGTWGMLDRLPRHADFELGYRRTVEFLARCDDYQGAAAAFSSFHEGSSRATISGSGRALFLDPDEEDVPAFVRDYTELGLSEGFTPFIWVLKWLCSANEEHPLVTSLANRAAPRGDFGVTHSVDSALLRELDAFLAYPKHHIPAAWRRFGASGSELQRVLSCLQSLCVYHLLSVHWGAIRHRIQGLGHESLLLELPVQQLVDLLVDVAGASRNCVTELVDSLTYGNGVASPDPALQPLFRASGDRVVIPPLLVISSRVERNFLTLTARQDPRSFDSQSDLFETGMIEELKPALRGRTSRTRYSVPGNPGAGDIDVLLADPTRRFLLVCELKWNIPPADTREVFSRRAAVDSKASQALRKLEAVNAAMGAVLGSLAIPCTGAWQTEAVVVLDGFSSAPRRGVTVATSPLFRLALEKHESLREAFDWLRGDEHAPRPGVHYETRRVRIRFGDRTLNTRGIAILPRAAALEISLPPS